MPPVDTDMTRSQASPTRRMFPIYVAVVVTEMVVLLGLWAFGVYFSS